MAFGAEAAGNCYRIRNRWGGLFATWIVQRREDPVGGKKFVERIVSEPEVIDQRPATSPLRSLPAGSAVPAVERSRGFASG